MIPETVHFVTPDGSDMVVLPRAVYEQLASMAAAAQPGAGLRPDLAEIPRTVLASIELGRSTLGAWREHRGLNQSQLARLSGVHRITIVRMEAGRFGDGHGRTRLRLAEALAAPITAL